MVCGGPAMVTRGQSVRLFENDLLEQLSRVHPLAPLVVWAPVIAWLLWRSLGATDLEAEIVAGLAAAGLLVWTLTEYAVHRWIFHLQPRSAAGRRLVFMIHGIHHAAPNDPGRLLMPPAPAILACGVLYAGVRAILDPGRADAFFAFFLVGFLAYDYIHLFTHVGRPRTRVGRFLRRWHMLHHFATPEARWGVSSPLWDHVFRSVPRG